MTDTDRPDGWLMVVDMQFAFSRPESRWGMESYDAVRAAVRELVPLFGERVVYTRFVPPTEGTGSWAPYYEKWSEFTRAEAPLPDGSGDGIWDIDLGEVGAEHVLDATTFSKWVPAELPAGLRESGTLYLAGVAYECCVLATALAAIDDGMEVHVIGDAVGAADDAMHRATTAILRGREPQLTITDTSRLRA
ncbi:cysteine hydrolase family protein [Leucobacter soli]|uniref:Isochorismatase-like domain-containing protein n=1 Tax=Leucobacter soli TaxID=2812850 RepID=A0A916JZ39_9MICO|nr:cysteine hydrolase [Leucobacter soli]CAG7615628.1 hypothetical protein LEUCIP111803_01899 [Leucobacter soli]